MRTIFVLGLTLCGAVLCCLLVSAQEQPPRAETALIQSIQGPALYKAYCASCHGANGKGGGPMAQSLKVKPTDLTHVSTRNGGKFPLTKIERIISGEQALPAGHGTRDMPLWGPIFSQIAWDQDLGRVRIDNLARYLREMQVK
jgi:mono/diheme cytochrome c family protein